MSKWQTLKEKSKSFNISFVGMWLFLLCSVPIPALAERHVLPYEGFTIVLDCKHKGAVQFEYEAIADTGSFSRKHSFKLDPNAPPNCQQTSSDSYSAPGVRFDRGHLVPANHLDHSKLAISQSNYMTNILPQVASMNRGAWLRTEELIECRRDKENLHVVGGVVWGRNPDDDWFLESHGVETPDYFWKAVIANNEVIAWLIPNSARATRSRLDKYLISVDELVEFLGNDYPIDGKDYFEHLDADERKHTPNKSWRIEPGCDKS